MGPGRRASPRQPFAGISRSCARCDACRDARDPDCPSYGIIGAYGGLPGAYAELLAVPIEHLLSMPDSLSFIDAAAVPLTFLTAWHMLTTSARLRPGETVLVVGAGAGISVAAIQIAKLAGARVIATSTSKEKLEGARGLGADETIHHPPEDPVSAVRPSRKDGGRRRPNTGVTADGGPEAPSPLGTPGLRRDFGRARRDRHATSSAAG